MGRRFSNSLYKTHSNDSVGIVLHDHLASASILTRLITRFVIKHNNFGDRFIGSCHLGDTRASFHKNIAITS